MCLCSSLFYFLYLPSHSGSWYLIQVLLCTTPMSIFFFFWAIQHHQLSGYTLPYFHYSCSYDSFFLPLSWHTAKFSWFHAQPKFLQVSPKLESPLRRAQQCLPFMGHKLYRCLQPFQCLALLWNQTHFYDVQGTGQSCAREWAAELVCVTWEPSLKGPCHKESLSFQGDLQEITATLLVNRFSHHSPVL